MLKGLEAEVAAELAVDPSQEVEVELRRHPQGVAVGLHEKADVLLEVEADEKVVPVVEGVPETVQEDAGLGGGEVPD